MPRPPSIGPYLGDPWSKIYIHRVKISGEERWVGFMGGGHNLSNLTLCVANGDGYGDCDKRGKGLFVIDMKDGSILWYYTHGSGGSQSSYMEYTMAGSPAILDLDLDGLIDTVYMGDLGGNMWRIRLCTAADSDSCNTSNWTLSRLFQAGATELASPSIPYLPRRRTPMAIYGSTGAPETA